MGSTYGMTFARAQLQRGNPDAALEAADKDVVERATSPEPHYDRACALEELERYDECLVSYERALVLNVTDKTLDPFMLDDAYFSALVAASKATPGPKAAALFARYAEICPNGEHLNDAKEWKARALGQLPSTLDKTKALG
jgi:tetratricopeptide (TPR) repeat protein